jgi:hypothetical protein
MYTQKETNRGKTTKEKKREMRSVDVWPLEYQVI